MSWIHNALCVGLPTDWWYPPQGNTAESIVTRSLAKAVCSVCPYREQCEQEYQELKEEWKIGIWAGITDSERDKIKKAKERGMIIEREPLIVKHQKEFLKERTQARILRKAEHEKRTNKNETIERTNQWLLDELTSTENEEAD